MVSAVAEDWTLPAILQGDVATAAATLTSYFAYRLSDGETPYYSGAMFERLGGGGDSADVRDVLTAEDLVAVSMLGVNVPAHAAIRLLGPAAGKASKLLAYIPTNLELADAGPEHIGPQSQAWELWALLHSMHGMGDTTTSKLLARKRPKLIPVQDSLVVKSLGHDLRRHGDFWTALHRHLQPDHPCGLQERLHAIRDHSGAGNDISLIRVLDIVLWLTAHDQLR